MAQRIRKGDTVEVLTGRNKGARGAVLSVDRARNRVLVERINLVKKHQKPSSQYRSGGIIEKELPIHISNVALVHNGERTRVGFRVVDGRKVRWSKKQNEAIDG
ncbi:MAG: 50S ribosomal protein L24 [Acidobacteriota bacterium]|nr:MAG: 50S ribosomal protein L24 [Acidobacteriota bacterium]